MTALHCSLYQGDVPSLVVALADPALVMRWQQSLGDELPALADRPLLAHLKRLSLTAARLLSSGFETVARQDGPACDALLTDLFAVATWHGWPLPVVLAGEQQVDVAGIPSGLLGTSHVQEGAGLWLLDHGTIALSRQRTAAAEADWSSHVRAP